MTISIGDRLPAASFRVPGEDGPTVATSDEIFGGKRVVLFAVPGAFTPTCSMNHLPGFLEHNDALREKGVDTIAVVAVNDVHVMKAWKASTGAGDRILFLSDGNGEFAKAIGLDADLSAGGLGLRSKRYSMLVEDGVVRQLNVEPSPGKTDTSSAETILAQL